MLTLTPDNLLHITGHLSVGLGVHALDRRIVLLGAKSVDGSMTNTMIEVGMIHALLV